MIQGLISLQSWKKNPIFYKYLDSFSYVLSSLLFSKRITSNVSSLEAFTLVLDIFSKFKL